MAYKLVKKYPLNFSKDITDVIDILSLKHGKEASLYGSARFKLNFPSDYDFFQEVEVNKYILKDIQDVIKTMMKTNNLFIGDIKSGMIPDLKVIDDDLNENNYNDKLSTIKTKLKKLYNNKNIDKEEYNESIALLKPDLKEFDIAIIRQEIRFEIIRWKPEDILNGYVNYRNIKVDFNKYLLTDSVTKIDALAWVNGIRFSEITMIYIFTKDNKMINRGFENIQKILIDAIPYLLFKGKYMKICKRINAIERLNEKPNNLLLRRIYRLTNSDLGQLNQVVSDIAVLKYLIENVKNIPRTKFIYEIDQMKYRLGNIITKKYLNIKNQDKVVKLLNLLEEDIIDIDKLDELNDILFNILQSEALKFMKKIKLYPIPKQFLPQVSNGEGYEEEFGEGNKSKRICMKRTDIINEHKKLIPILKKGTRKQRLTEASEQSKELSNYL
jgi:hypothetical protein